MTKIELTCKELTEVITDYLEEQLHLADRTRFETHLADCPGCKTYLAQMRTIIHSLSLLRAPTVSQEMKARLSAAFRRRQDL